MLRRSPFSARHLAQTILRSGLACAAILLALPPLAAQPGGAATGEGAAAPPAPPAAATTAPSLETLTEAERIAGLQRLLAADQQRLQDLEEQLQQLETEFQQAADQFTQLDAQLAATRANAQIAVDAQEQARRREALAALEQEWALARDGFDRIIERRKAVQEQRSIVTEKIAWEQRALSRLKQAQPAEPDAPEAVAEMHDGSAPTAEVPTPGPAAAAEPLPQRSDDSPLDPAAQGPNTTAAPTTDSPATAAPADEPPQPTVAEAVAEQQAVLKKSTNRPWMRAEN